MREPQLSPPFPQLRALADKKPVLPEAWNINFDTEKGIFYYPGIFLHLFRDLLAQPPPSAASLFRRLRLKPTLQLTLPSRRATGPTEGVSYVGKCLLYPVRWTTHPCPTVVCRCVCVCVCVCVRMPGAGVVTQEALPPGPSCSPHLLRLQTSKEPLRAISPILGYRWDN